METESHPVAGVDYPRTFQEMEQWFRDEAACRDYIRRLRWPDGFICPHCGVSGEPWLMSDELLRCCSCRARTSLTAGTIFEGTRKPLRTWFMAMWFVTSQKNGVSALGLQRVLGLGSYETAWTWLHKLRRAMVRPGRDRLRGTDLGRPPLLVGHPGGQLVAPLVPAVEPPTQYAPRRGPLYLSQLRQNQHTLGKSSA